MGEGQSAENDAGLEARYHVEKIHDPTGKHDECRYFVLDPQHDPIAETVLRQYAGIARTEGYSALADDLHAWVGTSHDAAALAAVKGLADRWADVVDECKASDPRWILDRSVTTLDTTLSELRRALDARPTPPGASADE